MTRPPTTLAALAQDPPDLPEGAVAEAVRAHFGLEGRYTPLVSERDQNFALQTAEGGRVVVKVISPLESAGATDFLVGALEHLDRRDGLAVPRVVHALDGGATARIATDHGEFSLRIVTWVDGEQLESLAIDERLARRFGAALAHLDAALQDYTHPGENPVLVWDLQRVAALRPLTDAIDEPAVRRGVTAAIDDFEARVAQAIPGLRRQVIHGDANPENVLFSDRGFGFIDFSDIVMAPRCFDVAIAASYLRSPGADPLALLGPFVAGYDDILPLAAAERALLFDLVRARLATTITMLYWRLEARPADDPYRRKSHDLEGDASQFLAALDRLGREKFTNKINYLSATLRANR